MSQHPNIILAGFMGTGKTTVGRALAARLGWKFLDTDHIIEHRAGKTVARIFEEDGEPAFRKFEAAAAEDLIHLRRHVIATGGGLVVNPANRAALHQAGTLVILVARPETILERVSRSPHPRPLLKDPDPLAKIRSLLAERAEAYADADLRIATDDKNVGEITDEIVHLLKP